MRCVSAGSPAHSMDGWLDGWIINAGEYGDATCIIHSLTPCPAFTTDTRALANTGAKTNNKTSGGTQHAPNFGFRPGNSESALSGRAITCDLISQNGKNVFYAPIF
jgi:hypothetical protein